MIKSRKKGSLDKTLLAATILIAILGMLFVYSATWDKLQSSDTFDKIFVRQCLWVLVGFILLTVIANSDYLKMLDFAYVAYGLNLALLVYLLMFGGERYGAKRWIDLGLFSLQPSEFIKLTVVFALAALFDQRRERIGSFANFTLACVLVVPAFLLIFLQPDLGTSIVLLPILFAVLLTAGEKIKYLLITIGAGLASLPFVWSLLKDYQKSRLLVFINPNIDPLGAGYTIIQSKIAVGSGGFFGKGWLNGTQSHLKFLPERHTDFIFSVIGEEWGFLGALLVIGLFGVVIARGISIISNIEDVAGKVVATGIVTLIAFQVIVNISMTIGLMPVVGLPLPMISYGGSNTIVTLMGIGFLLSVSREKSRWL